MNDKELEKRVERLEALVETLLEDNKLLRSERLEDKAAKEQFEADFFCKEGSDLE